MKLFFSLKTSHDASGTSAVGDVDSSLDSIVIVVEVVKISMTVPDGMGRERQTEPESGRTPVINLHGTRSRSRSSALDMNVLITRLLHRLPTSGNGDLK